jgi:glycerol-3-phosphate dehydrogenase
VEKISVNDVTTLNYTDKTRSEIINKLKTTDFDLIIIGGGITGAGVARDAVLRGLNVALVEKDDFAEGTSSRSSKLFHGGLRYLKTFEIKLVEEATRERNWLRDEGIPHNVRPLQFVAPVFGERTDPRTGRIIPASSNNMEMVKIALKTYDDVCKNQNYGPWEMIDDPKKIAELEPEFNTDQLIGAGLYYDTNMDDARIVIEIIKECIASGKCTALNYLKVIDFVHNEKGLISGVKVTENDKFSLETKHEAFMIKGNVVVNCAGIWADDVLGTKGKSKIIRPTKGIHFTVKHDDFKVYHGFGLSSIDDHRFFFVLPRENWVLIGTTDTFYDQDYNSPVATQADIDYLRNTVEFLFPNAKIDNTHILGTYSGLRPLVVEPGKSESEISRKHVCLEREDGLFTLVGGKYTTFRVMAEDLMRKYILKSKKVDLTKNGRLNVSDTKNIAKKPFVIALKRKEFEENPQYKAAKGTIDPNILDHLYIEFGYGAFPIINNLLQDPKFGARLLEDPKYPPKYFPWTKAEIIYIIQHEIPRHLKDVLCRRTEICWLVDPSRQRKIAEATAEIMGDILGWDKVRRQREIDFYLLYIKANSIFYKGEL